MRERKALYERSPIRVSSPRSLVGSSDCGPATNTGQSSPREARASAETFLAASHNRPADRMIRRFELGGEEAGGMPFHITVPGRLGRYKPQMTSWNARLGLTHARALSRP